MTRSSRGLSATRPGSAHARIALLSSVALLCACTSPLERASSLEVSVDADSIVRMNTARIDLFIEADRGRAASKNTTVWETITHQTKQTDPLAADWPWRLRIESDDASYARFNMTATALDSRRAVVAIVQVVRELAEARRSGLRAHFETACFRRTPRCEDGFTCSGGACVDASDVPSGTAADGGRSASPADGATETQADLGKGIATAGDPCQGDVRACADYGSQTPLSCANGVWKAEAACAEHERCQSAAGADRGSCKPIVDECANRLPNVPYCDGETMRVCPDLVAAAILDCREHERCTPEAASATCACEPGYVENPTTGRCAEANDCDTKNGGCDTLTKCSISRTKRVCSDCPTGYTGTGDQGCKPRLTGLGSSDGALAPAFDPSVDTYRVVVPLLVQRVVLTPRVPTGATVSLNGAALDPNGTWTTPVLGLKEPTKIDLRVTSAFGVSTPYTITIERTGSQKSYIKSPNSDSGDQFGFWLDLSGDTLLATAAFEDSAAQGVNGDQDSNAATDSGAAFVYVRDGDSWKQQAYLKPSDTSAYDYFGVRAALDGDTIVVGAIHALIFDPGIVASRPGAAYVYTRKDGAWSQTQRIAASDAQGADVFGTGIALDGNTLAVGAAWESTSADRSGAVYIFERTGSIWVERQKLKASKPSSGAYFGANLALEADRLVVGAPNDNRPLTRAGTAEIFVRRGGTWMSQQSLQPASLSENANFGFAVAVHGDRVIVGAPRTSPYFTETALPPGEVYVFDADGDHWNQTALLRSPNPIQLDCFGIGVALSDRGLAIGASGDTSGAKGIGGDPTRTDAKLSGAAYLYAPAADGWVETAYIKAHNTGANDAFGYVIALDAEALAVSATLESGDERDIGGTGASDAQTNSGAVYVFR